MAEAEAHWAGIDAVHAKNLFLRNVKGTRHFLVVLAAAAAPTWPSSATRSASASWASPRPSGCSQHLGLAPGSVSPFGLINDREHRVAVAIDVAIRDAERCGLPSQRQHRHAGGLWRRLPQFLAAVGHDVHWV